MDLSFGSFPERAASGTAARPTSSFRGTVAPLYLGKYFTEINHFKQTDINVLTWTILRQVAVSFYFKWKAFSF